MEVEAAWQLHMEDKIGSLHVGKYADIVVLG
jgi:predicted amidohydrolase YtcJ